MPDQEPVRFYFDPVCPWTWITYCWLREVADARGFSVELRSFSLMHLAKLDGNEMPEQYRERMIAGRDALRVFECLRKNGMGAQSHEFYEDLGARWHVRDEPRSQETILAAATALGASDEVAAACDNQEIDALLDASVHHACNQRARHRIARHRHAERAWLLWARGITSTDRCGCAQTLGRLLRAD